MLNQVQVLALGEPPPGVAVYADPVTPGIKHLVHATKDTVHRQVLVSGGVPGHVDGGHAAAVDLLGHPARWNQGEHPVVEAVAQ